MIALLGRRAGTAAGPGRAGESEPGQGFKFV